MKPFQFSRKNRWDRVDLQVSVLTAFIVIVSCYSIFFFNYYFSYQGMIEDLKNQALNIHNFLDEYLDTTSFYDLDSPYDADSPLYQECKQMLENVRNAAGVRYLYTAKKTDGGELVYLVDGLPSQNHDFRYIGDPIEPECIPDMERALLGETVFPEKISKTTWGNIFISYFPMHENDKVIGVVGIEFDAKRQYETYRNMMILTPVIIILFCIIAVITAVFLFRRISNPSYRDLASTDFLTGLKNRNAFEVDIHNMNYRKNKRPIALISIDLDQLKMINDTCGHDAGDEYIRACSGIMSECLNNTDILYRIGGDEFCIIAKCDDKEYPEALMKKIKERIRQKSPEHPFPMSLSIGYSIFDRDSEHDLLTTMKKADQAMYCDKAKNKERRKKEEGR